MSNILKIKNFFTLNETTAYLSNELEEPVSLATLYQLIADRQLTLSVRLINQAYALKGQIFECEDGDLVEFKTELTTGEALETSHFDYVTDDNSLPISSDRQFVFDNKAHIVDGMWDLAMLGEESRRVEHLYQNEVNGLKPLLTDIWGFYLKQGEIFCRLITKSQQKINEIQDDIASGLEFWADQRDLTVDQFMSFVEECWEELSEDEIQALELFSYLTNLPDDSLAFFEDSRSLEENDVQLVIKTSEIKRLLRSLDVGSDIAPQEAKQPARRAYTRNNDKQTRRKNKTQARYSAWQKKARELKKKHPNKSKTWIAEQIAKLPIAEGRSVDTIRKNIQI
ncbi:hypothetical protein [Vibrio alfacsensis]|uniref:hypothetical protein n=1 Tax=Vibrio alfacsensis TaxID=1074311 RepID=UPI0040678A31